MITRRLIQKAGFRFAIRPYAEVDVPHIFAAADESRRHVGEWMSWMTKDYKLSDAKDWVRHAISAWNDDKDYEFVIIDQEDWAIAGSCGLNQINRMDRVCNLGYWVRASKLKLGAARQVALLLREFGFDEVELNRLEIVVAVENVASQRVAESVGAVYEGIQRQRICIHGVAHDARMYALVRGAI